MSLQAGLDALKQGLYQEGVQLLEQFCRNCANPQTKEYLQAQMALVKAYPRVGQTKKAIALCQHLANSPHPQVSSLASQALSALSAAPETQQPAMTSSIGEQLRNPEQATKLLQAGNEALKQKRYPEAIELLQEFCHTQADAQSTAEYIKAQMGLVKAYQGYRQFDEAIALCQHLVGNTDPLIHNWAQQTLKFLFAAKAKQVESFSTEPENEVEEKTASTEAKKAKLPKAGRAAQTGVKLAMKGVAGSLALASGVTISLLFGMVLVLCLSLLFISYSSNPTLGLIIAIGFTLIFNTAAFFISPLIMDLTQSWLYKTRWVTLSEVQRYSPETAAVIDRVCQQKGIKQPRLGIINDQNPTAFTYGSLPNSARLVVSQGIFKYLDDDEIATVYAHELGHIVHWDFAVMTLASTLVQITYLIYTYARRMSISIRDKKIRSALEQAALAAYIFYIVGTYLLLYLSRTREYFADRFAAEVTGNPNALSRALVKIAYGILEEGERAKEPSQVIEGTRALGIYDSNCAALSGSAYRIASEPEKVGRVFLWDMFNPWGWWMELKSTHPLTGKRVRALSTYAEQLGLETEFNMALVVREGNKLNKKKLYGTFAADQLLYIIDILAAGVGVLIGLIPYAIRLGSPKLVVSLGLIGFGVGTLIKMLVMFPDFKRAPQSDVISLMSDPYATPLRGQPVKLQGKIIGRGGAGYKFGSDLKLQDETGLIYLRYSSRFGPIGNFLFGWLQAENQIGASVTVVGWFRRGMVPWVDFMQMDTDKGWNVKSYYRFWLLVLGIGAIVLGFVSPSLY